MDDSTFQHLFHVFRLSLETDVAGTRCNRHVMCIFRPSFIDIDGSMFLMLFDINIVAYSSFGLRTCLTILVTTF